MRKVLLSVLVICIASSPLIYLSTIWHQLPQSVPIHFGFDGKADDFGDKNTLLKLVVLLLLVSLGAYFLLKNLHKIDPKKKAKLSKNSLGKIAFAVVLLLTAINFLIVYSALSGQLKLDVAFIPILGLFFAYLGNLMYSIKPNYFVGVRTPWALENEETWKKTHQLAAKLWFAGGIIITSSALISPPLYAQIALLVIVAVIVIIPVVFSYIFFKQIKKNENLNV